MSDPSLPWLAVAFGVTWLVIGAYVVRLALVQRKIARRLEELPPGPRGERELG
jgi:CcmD family protein